MPFSTPIEVMPIWMVERNLVGLSCRASATAAPDSPASTMTCRRALRLAVRAISDIANQPFSRIRKSSSAVSIETGHPQAPSKQCAGKAARPRFSQAHKLRPLRVPPPRTMQHGLACW